MHCKVEKKGVDPMNIIPDNPFAPFRLRKEILGGGGRTFIKEKVEYLRHLIGEDFKKYL